MDTAPKDSKEETKALPSTPTEAPTEAPIIIDEAEEQRQALIVAIDTITKLGLAVVDKKKLSQSQCCSIC
jgi:hypothetical protein